MWPSDFMNIINLWLTTLLRVLAPFWSYTNNMFYATYTVQAWENVNELFGCFRDGLLHYNTSYEAVASVLVCYNLSKWSHRFFILRQPQPIQTLHLVQSFFSGLLHISMWVSLCDIPLSSNQQKSDYSFKL